MIKKGIITFWIITALLLYGCRHEESLRKGFQPELNSEQEVILGSNEGLDVSFGADGFFYSEDSLVRYYDTDTGQSYVICSRANCHHNSDECLAYFPESFYISLDNVAEYNGYIYCTAPNLKTGYAELVRIAPDSGIRTVVAAFPSASMMYSADGSKESVYYCTDITAVYYCNDYALLSLWMFDGDASSYIQFTGVNLKTGNIVNLNDDDGWTYNLKCVCVDYIFFERIRYTDKMLDEDSYYSIYGGKNVQIEGHSFDSYMDYENWYWNNGEKEYDLLAYDFEGKMTILEHGTYMQASPPISIEGYYKGKVLLYEDIDEGWATGIMSLFDLDNLNKETNIADGEPLWIAQGYYPNKIFSDGTFFYVNNMTDTQGDIYSYHMETGESEFLFTDDYRITFRIYASYRGGYVGKMMDAQDTMTFYWISKEDLLSGNLSAAVRYQL